MKAVNRKRIIIFVCAALFIVATVGVALILNHGTTKTRDNTAQTVVLSTASDNYDFADDRVIVTLNKEYGGINKLHNVSEFPGVDIADIDDLTHIEGDPYEKEYLNIDNFTQILKLTLSNPGKEEVLRAVEILNRLPNVKNAYPDYGDYADE